MVSMKPGEICFYGEQSFLSNFYRLDVKHRGRAYKTAEHLYQLAKCVKQSDKEKIRNAPTPRAAKILGRFVEIRPDWEDKKMDIMENILRIKFQKRSRLNRMLCETGDVKLTHLNFWHDTFWGVCACAQHKRTGQNILGVLLMKIRAENQNSE